MNRKAAYIMVAFIIAGILGYLGLVQGNNTPAATKQPTAIQEKKNDNFNKSQFSTSDPASIWIVSNKQRPLNPKTYAPTDLVKPAVATKGTQYLRSEAAKATETMFAAAAKAGINLRVDSAYRSYDKQVAVYGSEVKANGQKVADTESARPGYSEHQTGLAADFGPASGKCSIADCFGTLSEGKWMAENSYKYGFILRYTPDKVSVTGYRSEPWHFRYIGPALAGEMHKTNTKTLEEFFSLGSAPDYN